MSIRGRVYTLIAFAGLVAGCSSHSSNLNGTWSGPQTNSVTAPLVDNVTLSGENSNISGTFVANTQQGVLAYQGTINGTYSNPTFQFSVAVPQGGVVNEPNCSLAMLGTGTYVNNGGSITGASKSIAGTLTVTPTGNCSMGSSSVINNFVWGQ